MSNDSAFCFFFSFWVTNKQNNEPSPLKREIFFFSVSISKDCIFSAALIQSILYHLLESQTKLNGISIKFQLKYFQNSSSIKIGYLS